MEHGKGMTTQIVQNRALELARAGGIKTVTYNGLARELNIRPQSMYRYVRDLKELRVFLLGYFLEELIQEIKSEMAGLSPIDALRAFGMTMYDMCHENPRYYETFELMHSYELIPELRDQLQALGNLLQGPIEAMEGHTPQAFYHTQLFAAINLGYAQMAMTKFIPDSLQDDRWAYQCSLEEVLTRIFLPGANGGGKSVTK